MLPFPILHLFSGGLVPAKLPGDHVHQLQISAGSALNRGPSPNNYLWCNIGLGATLHLQQLGVGGHEIQSIHHQHNIPLLSMVPG